MKTSHALLLVLLFGFTTAQAGNLAFSDAANVSPPPAGTVGWANRAADLDPLPGFQTPPAGFGVVPFFWWLGDPLTKERLSWELEQMAGMGISGYQINYAHSDRGGLIYGLTFPSDPPLLSKDWWDLTGWFMQEAKKQGAGISLSDYTLGLGQGWLVDKMIRERPDLCGYQLRLVSGEPPAGALMTTSIEGKVTSVVAEKVPISIDPMHPDSGPEYAKRFFGEFEKYFPGEGGKGLNFFFSDELEFRVAGLIWNSRFADEFKKRKGYDLLPELPALFLDIGPRTPKVRLDYGDVKVALTEEGFFQPVFDWHQRRGMTMGCDHGGRGRDVVEFGDYFRTQRWNQGPGADQPNLSKDLIKAKVASSIAHLYLRPRVWLEGYHSSGWGTTSAGLVDATLANFVMGYNLLSFHGMYYATHGGWWEWAPPDNTFRMPYWKHLRGFMDCVQRLSYLLSQGQHRCDVAILYPVAPMEAGMGGSRAVDTAFKTGEQLYAQGVDFDFMDFESLDRAKIVGKELQVAEETYRVLVLPAMQAIRHSTLQKALEFHRAGGVVVALGAVPEASDRIGRNDPEVASMVKEMFPNGAGSDVFSKLPGRDYEGPGHILHRKIGQSDLYAIYNGSKGTECFFRATGKIELWDPWSGSTRPLTALSQTSSGTKLKLPLSETEIQLIVFSPGQAQLQPNPVPEPSPATMALDGDWEFELQPSCDNRFGDFHWPPTPDLIGAEARQMWYCEGDSTNGPWRRVTCAFGPQFIRSDAAPSDMTVPPLGGKPYEFSWRWGIENDPGHQGYHGLKEQVHDEFIALGNLKPTATDSSYEGVSSGYYLWTTIAAPRDMIAYALTGALKPAKMWLNGVPVSDKTLSLKAGANPLLVQYARPGRTYFVVSATNGLDVAEPPRDVAFKVSPLAMSWWNNPSVLPFDVRPQEKVPIGWYRFLSPPGLRAMTITARGKVQAWADGRPLEGTNRFVISPTSAKPAIVLLRIEQERGFYAGAALPDPIKLECGSGEMAAGDWSKIDGLLSYSGGAWYRKRVTIPSARRVTLDLGNVVASAEVRVNGQAAATLVAPPWIADITKQVKPGENRIEVLVYNTLANHYTSIPTRYRGSTVAGLLGPVSVNTSP